MILKQEIADIKDFKYPGRVYAAPGVFKHIRRQHNGSKKNKTPLSECILEDLEGAMRIILNNPDYVGEHFEKPGVCLELVKVIDDNILLALEFDIRDSYIYVSSLYPILNGKLKINCIVIE